MFLAKQLSVSKMAFLNKIFDIKTWITSPRSVMQHLVHVSRKARLFLACTRQIDGRRHPCHEQGIHRLREIRADDSERSYLRNQDEAELDLRDTLKHLLHEPRRG